MTNSEYDIKALLTPDAQGQIAAIYDNKAQATSSARALIERSVVSESQVTLIEGTEDDFGKKLEQDSTVIGNHLWSSHLKMGALGLGAGFIVASLLVAFGPALTQQNPIFTFIALISPGLFLGLFIAGLFALRPDRNNIIQTVRHGLRNGKAALVVNTKTPDGVTKVKNILENHSNNIVMAIR